MDGIRFASAVIIGGFASRRGTRPLLIRSELHHRWVRLRPPPLKWRILGLIESVTGVLMCGISVSVVFAIATRLVGPERQFGGAMDRKLSMSSVEHYMRERP